MTKMFLEPENGEEFGSSILGSLGKNLLESGAEEAASAGAAWIFNSIFGLTSSDAKLDKIQETLNEINGKLDQIEAEITAIGNAITQLSLDLNIDTQKIQVYISQASLLSAIATITDAYSSLSPANNLTWFAAEARLTAAGRGSHTAADLFQLAQTFSTKVLSGTDDLSQPILQINLALLGSGGTDKGLLLDWTNLFISEMGTDAYSPKLYSYYLTLENYFQQYLAYQLKGAAILVNAYCINDTDPQHPSQFAVDFLQGVEGDSGTPGFYQLIQDELEGFLQCAEKLVLSQMNMVKKGATIALPDDSQKVLTRADLFVALYNEAMGGHAPDGLYGRVLTRPSQITHSGGNNQGPALTPPNFSSSNGNVVATSSGYKTVDWSAADEYPILSSYEESDIKVVRYYWPWPATQPPSNQPIGSQSPFNVTPSYYDKTTLGSASAAGTTTAYIANFTDISALNFVPYFSSLLTHPDVWTVGGGGGFLKSLNTSLTGFPLSCQVTLELGGHDQNVIDTQLQGPLLLYGGATDSPVTLRLLVGLQYGYTSYPYFFRNQEYFCGKPDIYGYLKKADSETEGQIMNTESGQSHAWPFTARQSDNTPQTTSQDGSISHDFTVKGSTQYYLRFDQALDKGSGVLGATADISVKLTYIRLAWPLVETMPA